MGYPWYRDPGVHGATKQQEQLMDLTLDILIINPVLSKITEYFIVQYVRHKQTIFFALLKVEKL